MYRIALISDDQSFSYEVDGKEVKDYQQFRKDYISFVLQNIDFFPHYSLYQTIEYFAKLSGIDMNMDKARELLDKVQLNNDMHQNVMTLSLGEKQRLLIVCALIKQPSLLILDEPTASLDEDNERMVFKILKNLADEGIAVVIASHSDMAQEYADNIYIIENTHLKLIKGELDTKPLLKTKSHNMSSAFLKDYAIHYMRSYRFIYVFLILLLTLFLLSGSMFNLLVDYAKDNSLEVLQGQFDNKLIITSD
ncbi:MAG: ATP-binding cassette domain-containing protein [Erysipelotrichaceae bacterium]|nr:ATP-binding cassette domain-containing protein [Erysipelotrichaceae bacterium]